jgi:hypothetical protein
MTKVLKWILGILAVMVLLAVLAGAGYMIYTHWNGGWMMDRSAWRDFSPRNGLPERDYRMPMQPFERRGSVPFGMMPHGGMPFGGMRGGFFPFNFILGGLLRLGLLALLVYGAVMLWRSLRRPQSAAVAAAPGSAPLVEMPTVQAVVETTPCASCGTALQPGWKHCPNCGVER